MRIVHDVYVPMSVSASMKGPYYAELIACDAHPSNHPELPAGMFGGNEYIEIAGDPAFLVKLLEDWLRGLKSLQSRMPVAETTPAANPVEESGSVGALLNEQIPTVKDSLTVQPILTMLCMFCGSPAEFCPEEGVWRHKEPASEFFSQTFCRKYGYPIPVGISCADCNGAGGAPDDLCKKCKGTGVATAAATEAPEGEV